MIIDKETYKIDKKNYYSSRYKKKQIILADSLRKESYHIKRLYKKENGNTKKWCTFTVSREGQIYQHYNPIFYSDFFGDKEIDKHSISIVLENMSMVYYDVANESYVNSLNEVCPIELVYEKPWKGCRYWEEYTNEQVDAVVELCDYLCDKYHIEKDTIGYNNYDPDSHLFCGVITRSNINQDYTDVNPHFNWKKLLNKFNIHV
jgi:N-acetyl-anhydromuramyl-L-alanine amidase AmpD